MSHDETNLVGVGLEHHARSLGLSPLQNGPGISVRVALHAIRMWLDIFDPEFLPIALPTRGAWRREDFQELRGFHGRIL